MRDENYYNGKSSNTGLIIIVTLLVVAVVGLIGFIVYDKVINKTNEPNIEENNKEENNKESNEQNNSSDNIKEVSISSDIVTNLIYPQNEEGTGKVYNSGAQYWNYKNETIETLGRAVMMQSAARLIKPDNEFDEYLEYSSSKIKASFAKIYGPDVSYYDGNLEGTNSCGISEYNSITKKYIAYGGCGVDSVGYIVRNARTYKAQQNDQYIYVYTYVQSYVVAPSESGNETIVHLLDKNDKETKEINYNNRESIVKEMLANGQASTYKWTFKKQSDGNYYFYSGEWQ